MSSNSRQIFCAFFSPQRNPRDWERRYDEGTAPTRIPYGLEHAPDSMLVTVASATPGPKWVQRLTNLVERGTGGDVITAWRSRQTIRKARFVYAHSDPEFLGVALLLRLLRYRNVTCVAQPIWLVKSLSEGSVSRRIVTRWALARVDIMIFNAYPNYVVAKNYFPEVRIEYIPFGVSPLFVQDCDPPRSGILSVGNDRSRDWQTLATAAAGLGAPVRVAAAQTGIAADDRITVRPTRRFVELLELYRKSAVMVLAMSDNLHASGITSLLEASAAGLPTVATRTGGLDRYFSDDEVRFVSPGEPEGLRAEVQSLLGDPDAAMKLGNAAKAAFVQRGYDAQGYWLRVFAFLLEGSESTTADSCR